MQPCPTELTIRVEGKAHEVTSSTVPGSQDSIEEVPSDIDGRNVPSVVDNKGTDDNISGYTLHADLNNTSQTVVDVSSSEHSTEDEAILACDNSEKQVIPYDSSVNGAGPIAAVPLSSHPLERNTRRASLSVDTFTVQCANCFKWRLIPNKEKYEEIREHITDRPFMCETACEWRTGASCDDPPDIEQDGSRTWAMDKPGITKPPHGWERHLKIRRKGSTKFADVYYTDPTRIKKFRSMPDVEKFLENHTEFKAKGVTIAQFSFQSPSPLEEDYVRKRPARTQAFHDGNETRIPGFPQPSPAAHPLAWAPPEANFQFAEPVSWACPEENADLQPGTPEIDQGNQASKKPKRAP